VVLPKFLWLTIHGVVKADDFGLSQQLELVISDRALALLQKLGITHATVKGQLPSSSALWQASEPRKERENLGPSRAGSRCLHDYWDNARDDSIVILNTDNVSQAGVITYSTVWLNEMPTRVGRLGHPRRITLRLRQRT
jgi:hypothetical protein